MLKTKVNGVLLSVAGMSFSAFSSISVTALGLGITAVGAAITVYGADTLVSGIKKGVASVGDIITDKTKNLA